MLAFDLGKQSFQWIETGITKDVTRDTRVIKRPISRIESVIVAKGRMSHMMSTSGSASLLAGMTHRLLASER